MDSSLTQVPGQYILGTIFSSYPEGKTGVIDFAMGLKGPSYCWTITGDKGYLEFDRAKGNKIFFNSEKDSVEIAFLPKGIDDTNNFLSQITEGIPSYISLKEGREAVELSLIASDSAREGKKILL